MSGMMVFVFVYARTCVPVCEDQKLAVEVFLILLRLIYLAYYLSIYLFIIVCLFIFYTNSVMLSGQYTEKSSCSYSPTQYWDRKYLVLGGLFFVVIGDRNTDHHACVARLSQQSHISRLRCI